eukprot:m51a1_g24 hypothetical protein (188) ;mRNA; r:106267-107062
MVFFQCEGCGESVRKPKAEQHAWSCRAFAGFTCIDCLKRFPGDTFKTHNTCITESDKYNHKYVPKVKPKPLHQQQSAAPAKPAEDKPKEEAEKAAEDASADKKSKKRAAEPTEEKEAKADEAAEEPQKKKKKSAVPPEVLEFFRSRAERSLKKYPEWKDDVEGFKSAVLQTAARAASDAVDAVLASK